MQINHTESPTKSSSEADPPRADDSPRLPADDRWEWIEHVVPVSFLRVLWKGLFPSREDERPSPFNETTLILFVVFGLVPGWWVSHKLLRSRKRTARETRYVHMYNDSWFVVFVLIPLSMATYAGTAFATRLPQRLLLGITLIGAVTWIVRTPMLFRATHGAARWRVAVAHVAGLFVATIMAVLFAIASTIVTVAVMRSGF